MLTALALAHPFVHGVGFGFFPFFFLIPLFWVAVVVLIVVLVARGRRRRGWNGPWGAAPWAGSYGPWAGAQAARSAESTLAERFAQGDIDEVEYRARLEVLRANAPQPPHGPQQG